MRKIQLLILILCTLSLGVFGQGITITSGPEVLPDEVNHYAVKGVSDNGRYIYGGWVTLSMSASYMIRRVTKWRFSRPKAERAYR